ncbi:hypothetical protein MMAN_19530 [Mycobacterium mantenii]|uniref:Uncharacterized protein n=1 Tax=Mycobacterium mantenii TaxID=560555 RepID=A0A1X0F8N1_MYCNT|nr:hypothetical protein [Mycobacterium mantenii]MCV7245464.1 hypothetical protein [Mycobacterium mantenii]ORA98176.1 hypothetical protein BST30_26235 [Mycobacterium mantenii]BBY37819.1 hypothetical protein MMAN_19530 [Mycobacterium mantenii]
MDLKWWPVAATGSACFVAVVALAALLPMSAARRRLRPLANVARLTRLPEYAKVARLRSLSTVVTLVVLTVMFGAATWAAARPTVAGNDFDAVHPEDIMLCVGQPVTDAVTAELLDYFARQTATSPQAQRIGLTSVNRRLVPLTRDHQYAAARFADYVGAPNAQAASFTPPVPYTDYATSVNDVLALCLSGFSATEQRDTHRRSVIYLGPSELRAAGESRPSLFTDEAARELAGRAGAQINVIDTAPSSTSGALVAFTEHSGGRYVRPGTKSVTAALNEIRTHTPPARLANGTVVTADFRDAPMAPLVIALLAAAVLSVALLVLRR